MPAVTLASDELELVVMPEAGARMHSLQAYGHVLTRTPIDLETHHVSPFFWGGFHMLPWCNRIDPGPYHALGQRVTVPANSSDGTAIHGLHASAEWELIDEATWGVVADADGGWPWEHRATVRYGLAGPTLSIDYALTNTSAHPMPAGVGFHPWFRTPSTVTVPAALVFPDNTDTAVRPEPLDGSPATGPLDLREPRPVAIGTDATWVELTEPAVTIAWAGVGIGLTISADRPDIVAVAAHPPTFGAVAVELQTHVPAGLRRMLHGEPYGLHVLAADETLRLSLQLTAARL